MQKYYQDQAAGLAVRIKTLKGRAHGFVMGEILSFLSAIACVVFITLTDNINLRILELGGAVVCLVAYVVIRQRDTKNDEHIRQLEDLKQVYDNELRAIEGDFSCFNDGQRYVDPHHAYTYDLDIFGRDSLYQRMNRMVTTGGGDALAERLSCLDGRETPSELRDRLAQYDGAYHQRIQILAEDVKFRSKFISCGVRRQIDTEVIRKALHTAGDVKVNRLFAHPAILGLAVADLTAFFACIVLAAMGKVSGMLPVWWGILQFFGVYLLCMGTLKEVHKVINSLQGQVKQFAKVANLIETLSSHAPCGGETAQDSKCYKRFAESSDVFRRLTELLDGLDKRGNILGLFVVDTFALYDFFLVRKFIKWSRKDTQAFDEWIDRVIQMDQEVTIATFLYNHPDTCWAKMLDDEGVTYEAQALYHPFLGEKAVRNDFRIDDRQFYIITGANMAGKSTFLRSVGVNYILAMTGMPVFAASMCISKFKLFSSMRTTDDLAHGISYFNAELLRLKQLLAYCRKNDHTLIILDEILKGTNSLDKLNGSRLFLEHISRLPVSGIVATHDLELSKMEGDRYHNFCFEIELGTNVTYSYKITPGVARNQNATFLLNEILNDNTATDR
ncbi:MAG: MutS-related protein [Prevotella sp.]|jgi:hypothetical protein